MTDDLKTKKHLGITDEFSRSNVEAVTKQVFDKEKPDLSKLTPEVLAALFSFGAPN